MDPITRKETFLAKAGGQDVTTPTPVTREEYFLNEIANGGGGSGLPSVTSADNGKVLAVSNGAWGAYSNLFIVNVGFNPVTESYTADKTHAEIVEALYNGKNCIASRGGKIFNFSVFNSSSEGKEIVFLAQHPTITNSQFIQISEDESISCGDTKLFPDSYNGNVLTYDGNGWIGKPLPEKTFEVTLTPTAQDYSGTMDAQPSEIGDAFREGKTIIGYVYGMGASFVFTQFSGNVALGLVLYSDAILGDVLIKIATDDSSQTYSTTIYPLTPVSA